LKQAYIYSPTPDPFLVVVVVVMVMVVLLYYGDDGSAGGRVGAKSSHDPLINYGERDGEKAKGGEGEVEVCGYGVTGWGEFGGDELGQESRLISELVVNRYYSVSIGGSSLPFLSLSLVRDELDPIRGENPPITAMRSTQRSGWDSNTIGPTFSSGRDDLPCTSGQLGNFGATGSAGWTAHVLTGCT
jgi:hypothetical protein